MQEIDLSTIDTNLLKKLVLAHKKRENKLKDNNWIEKNRQKAREYFLKIKNDPEKYEAYKTMKRNEYHIKKAKKATELNELTNLIKMDIKEN